MLGHTRLLAVDDAGRHRLEVIEAQIHWMATLLDATRARYDRARLSARCRRLIGGRLRTVRDGLGL
jgi:outer membrane protein TolC